MSGEGWIAVGAPSSGTCCEDHVEALVLVLGPPFVGGYAYVVDSSSLSGEGAGELAFLNQLGSPLFNVGDVDGDTSDDLVAFDLSENEPLGSSAFLVTGPIAGRGRLAIETDATPVGWSGARRGSACAPDLCLATGVAFGPVGPGVQPDVTWSVVQPAEDIHVAAADLDGDGTRELLLWDPRTSSLHRLGPLAAGDIDPAAVATASYSPGAGTVSALETAWDWTGDGLEDVALAQGASVHVLSGPNLDPVATLPIDATALAGGDFDGDGAHDLAVGSGATVEIHLGPLPGAVAAVWIGHEHPTDAFGAALDAADLDGDGRDDLAVGAPEHGMADEVFPQPSGRLYLLWGGGL